MAEPEDIKSGYLHIIVDKWGGCWGPFQSSVAAAEWAKSKWPDQVQRGDANGGVGWDFHALHAPDE